MSQEHTEAHLRRQTRYLDFRPLPRSEEVQTELVRPAMTQLQDVWRRLRSNKLAMIGLVIVTFITLVAIVGPMLTPFEYFAQNLADTNRSPDGTHWFGTDRFGRDILTRVLYGARISMTVAYLSTLLNLLIGVAYGSVAGFLGGRVDQVMMRIVDTLIAIPSLLYVILLMMVLGPGLLTIIVAMAISGWLPMARMVRGQVLALKEREVVFAARLLGVSPGGIVVRHLLTNSIGPIIVLTTLSIPSAVFTEAFLSYIGLGVPAPLASWGSLASEATSTFMRHPYQMFFPALFISVTILGFNFFGDGLRDALDPETRR